MKKNTGVLICNLGSPVSLSLRDISKFLQEFLMDEYVLNMPFWKRWFVVNMIILKSRPPETRHAYTLIWTDEGSPLIVTSLSVQSKMKEILNCPVEIAMRYGEPSPTTALAKLKEQGVQNVIALQQYPHYAESSFLTGVKHVEKAAQESDHDWNLTNLAPYFNEPLYINALAESARPYLEKEFDLLLFSFHSIPVSHLTIANPTGTHCGSSPDCCKDQASKAFPTCYKAQCLATVDALIEKIELPAEKYQVAFQSRLGKEPWLTPSTDTVLES
ncbi:MAG: ferrochelatase, partial [Candidatus Lindowbacteria bacterium]|nr:ferrochelatase [Candidatus Lindowbacteria bacterium]